MNPIFDEFYNTQSAFKRPVDKSVEAKTPTNYNKKLID